MTLTEAIAVSKAADDAFEAATRAAGFKSRWDLPAAERMPHAVYTAYAAKLAADNVMHEAFEAVRNDKRKQMEGQ